MNISVHPIAAISHIAITTLGSQRVLSGVVLSSNRFCRAFSRRAFSFSDSEKFGLLKVCFRTIGRGSSGVYLSIRSVIFQPKKLGNFRPFGSSF